MFKSWLLFSLNSRVQSRISVNRQLVSLGEHKHSRLTDHPEARKCHGQRLRSPDDWDWRLIGKADRSDRADCSKDVDGEKHSGPEVIVAKKSIQPTVICALCSYSAGFHFPSL